MKTYAYGFPRIGKNREYKKLIESYWKGKISREELGRGMDNLQREIVGIYEGHVDNFPIGEMSLYDNMLDTALILGLYRAESLDEYFALCRGKDALEMTKWFNTNYHYLVPDFDAASDSVLRLLWNKQLEYLEKFGKGIPYIIGPFTFLKLSKGIKERDFRDKLIEAAGVYRQIVSAFERVHIDEPALVMELSDEEIDLVEEAYKIIDGADKIDLFTYYDEVDFPGRLFNLPVSGIGLDFVHGKGRLREYILENGFPGDKRLIAGVIDGRNVWRANLKEVASLVEELSGKVASLEISNAGPLYHIPVTREGEELDSALLERLSFAMEKLEELRAVADLVSGKASAEIAGVVVKGGENEAVRGRLLALTERDFKKPLGYSERRRIQDEKLKLPLFPSTTIGSYPQTPDVRKMRADFKKGKITEERYREYIDSKIREVIAFQEDIGLDVLVHGEFERSDMVEFFAEKLEGIATTKRGWIVSYGTRCYRPPIIHSDVYRPEDMTVREITYAQSLTDKPVKGMLTGPVTILAWSFVREDLLVSEVAYQIALALQDEVRALEAANISIVQIDEPAFRERAPIKRGEWDEYFSWAVRAFNLATVAKPETQIHTHMCYSEFGEIIKHIGEMDFDVISIEATRSRGDIIESFEGVDFERQIGLGVWDIHSPAVPTVEDMMKIVERALKVIPKENFWINPDCGLKTRGWEETKLSLENLVGLVKRLREENIS